MLPHDAEWHSPAAPVALGADEVHVWRASLSRPAAELAQLAELLAPDERARAARYHFERDRAYSIAGRGLLRRLLGMYLGAPPQALRFSYSAYGKPALADAAHAALCFNLSHADGQALYAVAWSRALGVDIERARPDVEHAAIAARFFSPAEQAALARLAPELRHQAFFSCWTRKEAYIKAHGMGLSLPLDQFDVELAPGRPARLLATRNDPADAERWSLRALDVGAGWAAALAAAGHGWQLRCWQAG